jgi:hypothetical protein
MNLLDYSVLQASRLFRKRIVILVPFGLESVLQKALGEMALVFRWQVKWEFLGLLDSMLARAPH